MNIFDQERAERCRWGLGAFLTSLCSLILLGLALNGCRPYEVAKRKYATDVVDTTFTNIVTTIPRDSVVKVIHNDTLRVTERHVERVKQGRATVTIIREPTNTTVIANCDSVRKEQKVVTKTVRQVWGVDPRFRDQARTWRTVAFVLIGLIGVGVVAYVLTYRYRLNLNLTKRNGAAAEPN